MKTGRYIDRTIAIISPGSDLSAAGEAHERVIANAAHRNSTESAMTSRLDQRGFHALMAIAMRRDGDRGEFARRAGRAAATPFLAAAPGATTRCCMALPRSGRRHPTIAARSGSRARPIE